MDPSDLRAFALRDWAAGKRPTQQYWAERYRREGAAPAWRASAMLLDHARRLGVLGPDDPSRAGDRAHHLELCRRLDGAARAFTRR
jgi:hypothetical protein